MTNTPKPQANETIEKILEKSYRYFNGLSHWNLEDRIPEVLIADVADIRRLMLQERINDLEAIYKRSYNGVISRSDVHYKIKDLKAQL